MAIPLYGPERDLAVQILRCPILSQCQGVDGYRLGCYDVTMGRLGPIHTNGFPEPWVGHLTKARLLFLSSNPGTGADPATDVPDLTADSSDDELLAYEDGAFDEDQCPGIADGEYLRNRLGERGKRVPYWHWVKVCAQDVWEGNPVSGRDYALTEVVHCGSHAQYGVQSALRTCATRYLQPVLAASPAAVVVVVGAVARGAFKEYFGVDTLDHFLGPVEVAGRKRLLVLVPHPSSPGGNRRFSERLSANQVAQVKHVLAEGR